MEGVSWALLRQVKVGLVILKNALGETSGVSEDMGKGCVRSGGVCMPQGRVGLRSDVSMPMCRSVCTTIQLFVAALSSVLTLNVFDHLPIACCGILDGWCWPCCSI